MKELDILQKIKVSYEKILADKLVGIYVHGSIAFGCFNWEKSDIDFLVIVNETLSQEEKESLITELLLLDEYCPPKGLETSVLLRENCNPFVYPTPFELHFSNMHKDRFRNNLSVTCKEMNGMDGDLAAHITVIKKAGIVLCGEEIDKVFAPVPKENYKASIFSDIEDAINEIEEDPVYYILNLCRVLAYLEEDLVLSKEQGGEWGKAHLPEKYAPVVKIALEAYQSDREGKGTELFRNNELQCFAEYMLENIKRN